MEKSEQQLLIRDNNGTKNAWKTTSMQEIILLSNNTTDELLIFTNLLK